MPATGNGSVKVSLARRLLRAQKPWALPMLEKLQVWSLRAAIRQQKLSDWCEKLRKAVADINDQYTTFSVDTPFMETKIRGQHAFQMRLLFKAVNALAKAKPEAKKALTLVDIGDSAGTHLAYLKALVAQDQRLSELGFDSFSVNLDPVAVKKIKAKGFKALHCRAEELVEKHDVRADVFFAFEMIEHLKDPVGFLDSLSRQGGADVFVLTVPYLSRSRVGLHHIRQGRQEPISPERTHLFELCPEDWKLLFKHAGWRIAEEQIYRQYPRWTPASPALRNFWRKYDFEGFYGAILERDRSWADCYQDEPVDH
jgi:hypothetical protein